MIHDKTCKCQECCHMRVADENADLRQQLAESKAETKSAWKDAGAAWIAVADLNRRLAEKEESVNDYAKELERVRLWLKDNYAQIADLKAQLEKAREALPPAEKLLLLAEWLDVDDKARGRPASNNQVQQDLRLWAAKIRSALALEPAEPQPKSLSQERRLKAQREEPTCCVCGSTLQEVRPGKHQCNKCETKVEPEGGK